MPCIFTTISFGTEDVLQHRPPIPIEAGHPVEAALKLSISARGAAKISPATIAFVEAIMKAKPHPEQGFRACLGILRPARSYGSARIEALGIPGRLRRNAQSWTSCRPRRCAARA